MDDPLNSRQIEDGYSADTPIGSINRAHRNARTIVWLERQSLDEQAKMRAVYAGELGMPADEIIWLPESMDDDSLTWVFYRYANWINHL